MGNSLSNDRLEPTIRDLFLTAIDYVSKTAAHEESLRLLNQAHNNFNNKKDIDQITLDYISPIIQKLNMPPPQQTNEDAAWAGLREYSTRYNELAIKTLKKISHLIDKYAKLTFPLNHSNRNHTYNPNSNISSNSSVTCDPVIEL